MTTEKLLTYNGKWQQSQRDDRRNLCGIFWVGARTQLDWRIGDSNQISEGTVAVMAYGDGGVLQNANGAKTGAVGAADDRLAALVDVWPELSADIQSKILKLVNNPVSVSRTS